MGSRVCRRPSDGIAQVHRNMQTVFTATVFASAFLNAAVPASADSLGEGVNSVLADLGIGGACAGYLSGTNAVSKACVQTFNAALLFHPPIVLSVSHTCGGRNGTPCKSRAQERPVGLYFSDTSCFTCHPESHIPLRLDID
jgi:hypothetical protein